LEKSALESVTTVKKIEVLPSTTTFFLMKQGSTTDAGTFSN